MRPNGYIKVHRRIARSSIWKNHNDFRMAMTILLMANWERGKFASRNGDVVEVNRGELVTSLATLTMESGLSVRETRTALLHLEKARFLTSKTTSHYRVIKVWNYSQYQDVVSESDNQSDKHPTSTRQRYKKVKKVKKNNSGGQGRSGRKIKHPIEDCQTVVGCYLEASGKGNSDVAKDQGGWGRWILEADQLLGELGGRADLSIECIEDRARQWSGVSDWTLTAVARRAKDWLAKKQAEASK